MSGFKIKPGKQTQLNTLFFPKIAPSKFPSRYSQLTVLGQLESGIVGKQSKTIQLRTPFPGKKAQLLLQQPKRVTSDRPVSLLSQRPAVLKRTRFKFSDLQVAKSKPLPTLDFTTRLASVATRAQTTPQRSRQSTRTLVTFAAAQAQPTAQASTTKLAQQQKQSLAQTTVTVQQFKTPSRTSTRVIRRPTLPGRRTIREEPITELVIPFKLPKFDNQQLFKKPKKEKKLKRVLKYRPSLAAIELNIKGIKPKIVTGIGARPLGKMI
jgi:hypothetical protein